MPRADIMRNRGYCEYYAGGSSIICLKKKKEKKKLSIIWLSSLLIWVNICRSFILPTPPLSLPTTAHPLPQICLTPQCACCSIYHIKLCMLFADTHSINPCRLKLNRIMVYLCLFWFVCFSGNVQSMVFVDANSIFWLPETGYTITQLYCSKI